MTVHTIDLHFQGVSQSIAAFAVPTDAGLVLIEAGPHSTLPALARGLQHLGYQLEDVRHVLLSHIHLDHAGAAWCFAAQGATIYVHPEGIRHLASPERLMQSARMIYQDQMDALWGDMRPIDAQQLRAVSQGEVIEIGGQAFTAWHTPGHAVHHIAWQLGSHLFAGDVAGVKIGAGPVVPPCPPPDIHIEDWAASIVLIKGLPIERLHLTHYGEVPHVQEHLQELEARLQGWAEWMRPHFEAQASQAEIVPLFEQFVERELIENGVPAAHLEKYAKANPAWMGVAGLMRYWKKKAEAEKAQ